MSDTVSFEFFSDTNISNAYDELQLMSLDTLSKEGTTLYVSWQDMNEMGDSIEAIMGDNGGERIY